MPGGILLPPPGREPRTGQEFNSATTTGADFFHPALGPSHGQPEPWSLLRWTARETVKDLPRSVTRRPPEFSVILSRAAWGFQVQRPAASRSRPAGCCVGAPPPDGNPDGAQRKQLEGVRDPRVQQGNNTHARTRVLGIDAARAGSAGKSRRLNSQAARHRMS